MDYRLLAHEVKLEPSDISDTRIVSAYGFRKFPKLLEQISSSNVDIRSNALDVLCEELLNPYGVYSSASAGVVKVLGNLVIDRDVRSRIRSAKALSIISKDANGLNAILDHDSLSNIIKAITIEDNEFKTFLYECLMHLTRSALGVDACNAVGCIQIFANGIESEIDNIKILILQAIYNIAGSDKGLQASLTNGIIEICVRLLKSSNPKVQSNAARTLGFLCFDERGKTIALSSNMISSIFEVLDTYKSLDSEVLGSMLMALMSVSSTDEGKKQCFNERFIETIVELLDHRDKLVKLNVLKVISNIAVYPPIRKLLMLNNRCVSNLNSIYLTDDPFLKKHALIASNAVTWKP